MYRLTENKIVLVTRPTRLEELIVRFNTVAQAKFYVEHLGADFSDYEREHAVYRHATAEAEAALSALGRLQTLRREFLPNFIFGPADTIVVLGQDVHAWTGPGSDHVVDGTPQRTQLVDVVDGGELVDVP